MQKAVQDVLIGFVAAMAEVQAEVMTEAQKAGIAHARASEESAYLGRKPSFGRAQLDTIRDMIAQGASPSIVAKVAGVSRQVVYRVKDDPAKTEAILAEWD
jgi:putative DNA-invertase from lambdoid prophage Rac